jgi:hypothetical protein
MIDCPRFHRDHLIPPTGWVFVFGANLRGVHGKGAAKVAHVNFGAEYGVGEGRTGDAYAIPTKSAPTMKPEDRLPLDRVQQSVQRFLEHAQEHPAERFFVTRVGCVLAGFKDEEIAPLFADAPENCCLPEDWREYVTELQRRPLRQREGR